MNNSLNFLPVALSLLPHSIQQKVIDKIDQFTPSQLYKMLEEKNELSIQGFFKNNYPSNPLEAAEKVINICNKNDIVITNIWNENYPSLLREISSPPFVLYSDKPIIDQKMFSIVGTRNSDTNSNFISNKISSEMSKLGFSIVSGMAMGIDRHAHVGALDLDSSTIAVLPSGIDLPYPKNNIDIYNKIKKSKNSMVVSEYPPGILPQKWSFVGRNRLISGLSVGTVIVKAKVKSGAMITARHTIEQNRELFVCPGNSFDDSYSGCNKLIKDGAKLVHVIDDIISELPNYSISEIVQPCLFEDTSEDEDTKKIFANDLDDLIINILKKGSIESDAISRKLKRDINEINETVMILELSNKIRRDGNLLILI